MNWFGHRSEGNAATYALLDEAVRIAQETGNPWLIAFSRALAYGMPRDDLDLEFIKSALQEAISLTRPFGEHYIHCRTIHAMGDMYRWRGEHAKAIPRLIATSSTASIWTKPPSSESGPKDAL